MVTYIEYLSSMSERNQEIRKMVEAGKSLTEIATQYQLTPERIRQISRGIPHRGPGRRPKQITNKQAQS